MRLSEPLRLWGGLDPTSGVIIDREHPQHGRTIAGRVIAMPATAGSTSGPSVLADCLRRGVGPAGFILESADVSVLSAVMMARSLYARDCFIHYLPKERWPIAGEWYSWR